MTVFSTLALMWALVAPAAAHRSSAEERYIATGDASIKKFADAKIGEKVNAAEERACNAERARALNKLEEMSSGLRPEGAEGEAFAKRLDEMSGKIEADFKRCFAERGPKEPRFAEAVKLAKDLYDRMPVK